LKIVLFGQGRQEIPVEIGSCGGHEKQVPVLISKFDPVGQL
jgi:hypothetical protein